MPAEKPQLAAFRIRRFAWGVHIWYGGSDPRVVYVGQGAIAERLSAHRTSPDILRYAPQGLFVTWSPVQVDRIGGVESFLVKALRPLENKVVPSAPPVSVNFP